MKSEHYAFDFETTVIDERLYLDDKGNPIHNITDILNQFKTEVWAAGLYQIESDTPFKLFKTLDAFMEHIFGLKKNINLYSVNGSNFDNHFIIDWLGQHDYEHKQKIEYKGLDERFWLGDHQKLTIWHDGHFINLFDIRKIVPGSVKVYGEMLSKKYDEDIHKGPDTPLLKSIPSKDNPKWLEWTDYIKRDVYVIKRLMEDSDLNLCRVYENNFNTSAGQSYTELINDGQVVFKERPIEPACRYMKPVLAKNETVDKWYKDIMNNWNYTKRLMTSSEVKAFEREQAEKDFYKPSFRRSLNTIHHEDNPVLLKRPRIKTENKKGTLAYKRELIERLKDKTLTDKERETIETALEQNRIMLVISGLNDIAKMAFRGGLSMVNPLYLGKLVNGIVLDYTSHYPYIYAFERLPGRLTSIDDKVMSISDINKESLSFTIFKKLHAKAKPKALQMFKPKTSDKKNVLVTSEEQAKFGAHYDKRNVYTREIDFVDYTMTDVGLKYLAENYDIYDYEIERVIYFEDNKQLMQLCQNHYNKWITIKEEARASGNVTLEILAKIMLNSPYGKFGNYDKEYDVYGYALEDGLYKRVLIEKDLGGRVKAEVPVAAYIAEYGRVKLARAINHIGIDRFIYCDTDSIHVSGWDLPEDIDLSGNPGELKLEYYFKDGQYLKAKTYGSYKKISEDKYNDYLKANEEIRSRNDSLELENAKESEHVLLSDDDGYFIWKTTCAGFTKQIEPRNFKLGMGIDDKRSVVVNGGKVILDTTITIHPMTWGVARLIEFEYDIKLPEYLYQKPCYEELEILRELEFEKNIEQHAQNFIDRFDKYKLEMG